ncbi:MAG TPA: acyltransferase [Puia sp.]
MKRIKILDSCRGLAALIVVFHHLYTRFGYLYPQENSMAIHGVLNFISQLNGEAVLFFFILSGFSIRLSLRKGLPVRKESLNEYLYRRFKRILPLYFLALLVTFIAGLIIHQTFKPDYSIRNLIGNLFFLQAPVSYRGYWFSPYGENGPLWSLSFEMFYYLFFPLFIFTLVKLFKSEKFSPVQQRGILGIAFVFSLACLFINNYFFFPYIAYAKFFFLWYCGFFLADLYLENAIRFDANFMVMVLFCLLLGGLMTFRRSDSLVQLFEGVTMLTVFYILMAIRRNFSRRFLARTEKTANFLFFYLGKGSYAFYLLHYPVILVLKSFENISVPVIVLTMAVLAYLCVHLEEFFVERKFRIFQVQYVR